ncbi:hypothetical protein BV20DRAFT_955037 [Pilatotrama ljubarskyi]|nr:hypothetical protein BV20DRAFT_955037 [Pilatotrama ljubarskyi]
MSFAPLPGTYAVAQIDVQATLAGLEDEKALSAASRLETKKYLIYLHTPLQLPYPGSGPWKYLAYFVGPDPRPEEPENFITSDMCIPIFPNTNHPTGREPVRPNSPFPFPNCSHWVGWDLERKVRVLEGHYPAEQSVKLPPNEHVDMEDYCGDDLTRSHRMKVDRAAEPEVSICGRRESTMLNLGAVNVAVRGGQRGTSTVHRQPHPRARTERLHRFYRGSRGPGHLRIRASKWRRSPACN